MVAINTSTVMVIGGENRARWAHSATYFFNPIAADQPTWTEGPSLMEARTLQASAILGHHVVTAGGQQYATDQLSSVEILDLNSFPYQWVQGPRPGPCTYEV